MKKLGELCSLCIQMFDLSLTTTIFMLLLSKDNSDQKTAFSCYGLGPVRGVLRLTTG